MADHNAPCGCDESLRLRKENKILKKTIATALLEARVYDGIPEMDKIAAILEAAVKEVAG